jgi:hypothetical protein
MYPRRTAGKWTPISAGGWNAAMLAAERSEQAFNHRPIAPDAASVVLNRTVIDIRNTTGDQIDRSEILGIGDWTFDPSEPEQLEELHETLCVEGVVPESPAHDDQFVVLTRDLADGEIGPAVMFGLVAVLVEISDESHKFCTIADGVVGNLKSGASGRGRILKAQPGTGSKWCLVQLGGGSGLTKVFCVTNDTITHHGTGEVERIKRDGGAWVRSGETFDAIDIFTNTGETIPTCFVVGVVDYEGLRVIDSIYCKASDWLGC